MACFACRVPLFYPDIYAFYRNVQLRKIHTLAIECLFGFIYDTRPV